MAITRLTKNGVTFNRAGTDNSWRLVYYDNKAILFEATGNTDSINTIEEFETEQEGIDRIEELELIREEV